VEDFEKFEKAVANLEKKRDDLKAAIKNIGAAKTKVVVLQGEPGDIIAGIAARTLLDAVSPSLLKQLKKIGLGPGKRGTLF